MELTTTKPQSAVSRFNSYLEEYKSGLTNVEAHNHFKMLAKDAKEAARMAEGRSSACCRFSFENPTVPGAQEQADKAFAVAAEAKKLALLVTTLYGTLIKSIVFGHGWEQFRPGAYKVKEAAL